MTASSAPGHSAPTAAPTDPSDLEPDHAADAGADHPDDWTEPGDDDPGTYVMPADRITIEVPEEDPFAGTLSIGSNNVDLWLALTPTVAADLIEQLEEVLGRQQEVMGVPAGRRTSITDDELDDDEEEPAADEGGGEGGFFARNRDPLGVRYLVSRSKNAPLLVAGAIAALLLLSLLASRLL